MAISAKKKEGKTGPLVPRKVGDKVDTSDYPYAENYPGLKDWLNERDARCVWQLPMQCEHERRGHRDPPTAYIECWGFPVPHPIDPEGVSTRLAILVVHGRKLGWEIYTANDSNQVAATFEDVERRIGVRTNPMADVLTEVLDVLEAGGDFQLGPEGRHATLIERIKAATGAKS